MKVILLENTPKVGLKDEIKEVKAGFARNFLIPQGKAVLATPGVQRAAQHRKNSRKIKMEELSKKVAESIDSLSEKEIIIEAKASDQGHLFAGIDAIELAKIITEQTGIEIEAEYLDLSGNIKSTGEHILKVKVGEKEGNIKVIINSK